MSKTVTVPADVLLRMAQKAIEFRYPQICKHLVASDILSMLEENGFPVTPDFCALVKAVVNAEDDEALTLFNKMLP